MKANASEQLRRSPAKQSKYRKDCHIATISSGKLVARRCLKSVAMKILLSAKSMKNSESATFG